MTPSGCSDFPPLFLFMLQKERWDTRKKTKCPPHPRRGLSEPMEGSLVPLSPEANSSSCLVPPFKDNVVVSQPWGALVTQGHWERGTECDHTAAQALPAPLLAQERIKSYFQRQSPWLLNSLSWELQLCWNSAWFALRVMWGTSCPLENPALHASADSPLTLPPHSSGLTCSLWCFPGQTPSDSQFNTIFL